MFFDEPFGGLIPGARGAVLSVLLRTGVPLTGRQIHALVSDQHSLWSVQEALKELTLLGLVHTRAVGRAGLHEINDEHAAAAPLRTLADPIASLTAAIQGFVDERVHAVVLFGSIARGEATRDSDIDIAVIATSGWNGRDLLQDAVHSRTGNGCDVLVFTPASFRQRTRAGEPVVADIVRDGIALVGTKPRPATGAA